MCRSAEPVKRGKFKVSVMYGEMSTVPLEQLTTVVDTVSFLACAQQYMIVVHYCVCHTGSVVLNLILRLCVINFYLDYCCFIAGDATNDW